MNTQNIVYLTGEQAIPGIDRLVYYNDSHHRKHWAGWYGNEEIYLYGSAEEPPPERIAIAQKVMPLLEAIELRARTDVKHQFSTGELGEDWNLVEVYFGFDGTEPADEFSLHYWGSIWGGPIYYVQYRLNVEQPLHSTVVKFGTRK
jgi:hypothetical protein